MGTFLSEHYRKIRTMTLFGNFEHPLKSNVGNNHTNDPDDIIKTKRHLNKLGYFVEGTEAPFGEHARKIQKKNSAIVVSYGITDALN